MTRRMARRAAIMLTGDLKKTPLYWVALCNELPITANGETVDEVMDGVANAAQAYLDTLLLVDYDAYEEKLEEILAPDQFMETPAKEFSEEERYFKLPVKGQLAPSFVRDAIHA